MRYKRIRSVFDEFSLPMLVEKSIAFIREHEPQEGYFVGFSGGKDSIATLELVKRSGVKHAAGYNVTGIDYPEIPKFIRANYPEVQFLYPKTTFWAQMRQRGLPYRHLRWCCRLLKEMNNGYKHCIMGIRAEESAKRAMRGPIDTHRGKVTYKPIFRWPEWAVWQFIEENNLPYPSVYDTGARRVGCIACPFAVCGSNPSAVAQRQKEMAMFPHWYKVHRKVAKEFFDTHPRTENAKFSDFDSWYNAYWTT